MAMSKRQRTGKGKSIDVGSRNSIASLVSVLSSGGESVYEDAMSSMDEDDENYPSHRRSRSSTGSWAVMRSLNAWFLRRLVQVDGLKPRAPQALLLVP